MYQYRVVNAVVIDGDTVDLTLDIGFGIYRRDRFRLYGPDVTGKMGLNCPEIDTLEGQEAKNFLTKLLINVLANSELVAHTVKDRKEKFGRYLVVLSDGSDPSDIDKNINHLLVINNHAVLKSY